MKLERVSFFKAHLPWTGFRGADIVYTDFANAKLKNATFGCDEREDSQTVHCTTITNTCFSDADLEHAEFEQITIKNSDFSGAVLDNAAFRDVEFENVVFDSDVDLEEILDDKSRRSLEGNSSEDEPIDACTADWREQLLPWDLMSVRDRRSIPPGHPLSRRTLSAGIRD